MFDSVIVNGDSYSAAKDQFKVYGEYIAEKLNLPLVNLAVQGSNNERILRSTTEFLLGTDFKSPLVIIGWSFIRRLEVWYYGSNKKVISRIPDQSPEDHTSLRLITLNHLINENEATIEQRALINEDLFVHKQLINFYTDLFLFSKFLQKEEISYFFFSGAKNNEIPIHCFPAIENLSMVQSVTQDPSVYKLHDFFIMDWAKKHDPEASPVTGHLSATGHKNFADYLLTLLPLNHDIQSHQTTQK
jgi:hypothetical protein